MKLSQKKSLVGFLFCLPLLLGVLVVYGFPFCITLLRSLQQSAANSTFTLAHYTGLFSNSAFQLAARNTFTFWAIALPCNLLLGLGLAYLCNHCFLRHCKPILVFSAMVPAACSVALLQLLLPTDTYAALIASEVHAPLFILLLFLWKYLGYTILILSAALYTISPELIEAATLCGATGWQTFRYIELPLLLPALGASGFFAFLNSFKIFREAYLIGGSYPNNSLYSLQHFLSNNFSNMNFSRLAAASVLVVVFLCGIFALALGLARRMKEVWQ
ncbi:MAG: ABC transporter permease subunit [Faecalibacterium sp.]